MTPGQARAVAELRALDRWSDGIVTIRGEVEDSSTFVKVPITVSTQGVRRYPGGIPVKTLEDLEVWIPDDMPLNPPHLLASDSRWAAHPHVTGRCLCLYIDPTNQWSPSDGMNGFVQRMGEWFVAAAAGELDPHGGPIHPPVPLGIGFSQTRLVIVRDIPERERNRLLWANLVPHGDHRLDVTEFHREAPRATPRIAAAVVSNRPLEGDYASTYGALVTQLESLGYSSRELGRHIVETAQRNPNGTPLVVLVGTLNRGQDGRRFHHLVAWELPAGLADRFRSPGEAEPEVDDAESLEKFYRWAEGDPLKWAQIYEARPQVTRGRDQQSSTSVFANKSIEVWGCGALGGWIADFIARARPRALMLRDRATVGPGLVVRQPYDNCDVTLTKAGALAKRLQRIHPDSSEIKYSPCDVIGVEGITADLTGVDLVIDATASRGVGAALDRYAASHPEHPPIVSVVTDARCEFTAIFAAPTGSAGPGFSARDALKQLESSPHGQRFIEAFWKSPEIEDLVHPEPGCSAPTFHGSAADVASAASTLTNQTAQFLEDPTGHQTLLTALPHAKSPPRRSPWTIRTPLPTRVDSAGDYPVFLTERARAVIHDIASQTFEAARPVETGGLLFGERNDATETITIDSASGPPADSSHSHLGFDRGTANLDEILSALHHRSTDGAQYLGDWHTHPHGPAALSTTDCNAAKGLCSDGASVLLIWAGTPDDTKWTARVLHPDIVSQPPRKESTAAWNPTEAVAPRTRPTPQVKASQRHCGAPMPPRRPLEPPRSGRPAILLALSGGGFRATLAALGVLRFLADAVLLDDVRIISSVSGGSLANAAIATRWNDARTQPAFDYLVLNPFLTSVTTKSFLADLLRNCWRAAKPRASRTTVLADRLDRRFLDGHILEDLPSGCWFMFNGTNINEGIRFRCDADVVGDYVNGSVPTPGTGLRVSTAVAASAAVPGLFPPLRFDHLDFPCNAGTSVEVADGGIYDNLGLEAIQRERLEFEHSFLISLNAGSRLPSDTRAGLGRLPIAGALWRANAVMYRQTSALRTRRLFREADTTHGRPFVAFNLATEFSASAPEIERERIEEWRSRNQEHSRPERDAIVAIPTNFAKLAPQDALALVQRGWWLTGATLAVHHPELLTNRPVWTNPLEPQ